MSTQSWGLTAGAPTGAGLSARNLPIRHRRLSQWRTHLGPISRRPVAVQLLPPRLQQLPHQIAAGSSTTRTRTGRATEGRHRLYRRDTNRPGEGPQDLPSIPQVGVASSPGRTGEPTSQQASRPQNWGIDQQILSILAQVLGVARTTGRTVVPAGWPSPKERKIPDAIGKTTTPTHSIRAQGLEPTFILKSIRAQGRGAKIS